MKAKPTAIDLFCGAGGLTEGLTQAGFRVVAAVEIDALACETYRDNHKRVHLWQKDVRRVSGAELLRATKLKKGELDLLAACPPCQGFSAIRTKNRGRRVNDSRNSLILDVLRIVRSVRPRSVMLENVPHLALDRRYKAFCKALTALGYSIDWDVLNAMNYGVPQRRRRLVLIATANAEAPFPNHARVTRTVRQSIGRLPQPRQSRDALHNYELKLSPAVLDRISRVPRNGGSRTDLRLKDQLECHRRVDGFKDIYGRMAWDRPSPTITGGCINPSKGRFVHPTANRPITLREAALLQSFPRSYKFSLRNGRYAVAQMIGNALPPEFIRRIGVALKRALVG
jgi:DNA (cytosine-5)-methyltransferase 1